jgi:preprotein translocase subunit YajC
MVPFLEVLPHMLSAVTLDDNSIGLIACLIGMGGGFYITQYRDKLKAQKAKIERKNDRQPPRE